MSHLDFSIQSVSAKTIIIEVGNPSAFVDDFTLGSLVKIQYRVDSSRFVVGIIDNYRIKSIDPIPTNNEHEGQSIDPAFILELSIAGTMILKDSKIFFERGSYGITLPPGSIIEILSGEEITALYKTGITENQSFNFAYSTHSGESIDLPINGNRFFNKHFSVVGSTGSGKSHTLAKILQTAISNNGDFKLNNTHIVLFDIHGEYASAFKNTGNLLDVTNLILPYWLLNGEELEELFLDTESNDHNQRNVFMQAVINSKRQNFNGPEDTKELIHFDSPTMFCLSEVLNFIQDKNTEMIPGANANKKQGPLFDKLLNFISRFETKINDKRLGFLVGENAKNASFVDAIQQLISYRSGREKNITVIDLSGIPFEVLSISVSLISRILFDFGYFSKKLKGHDCDSPLLLVYEEAHKYVPKSDLKKFRSSKASIERIAKEGRKYGVTLGIISQRPSEISETIFSQCSNFVVMRLTNPDDQAYIKKLLPDTLGNLTDNLSSMGTGEALLIGDSIALPSIVKIKECDSRPSSSDIAYYEIWKDEWKKLLFEDIEKAWTS